MYVSLWFYCWDMFFVKLPIRCLEILQICKKKLAVKWEVLDHICSLFYSRRIPQLYAENCNIHQWYFVTKIFLTYCEKKIVVVIKKNFWNWGSRPRICKNFKIPRTIYSNSERSEQFLVTECFFNLFLEVSHI